MSKELIPVPIIGILSEELKERYTHADLDRLFSYADAPGDPPEGSKSAKVNEWLRRTNKQHAEPLRVLGVILEDFFERELSDEDDQEFWEVEWRKSVKRVEAALGKRSLIYRVGGKISMNSSTATVALAERVSADGLSAIHIEIDRALKLVADDPNGAAQYAGNVLEAALKHYLVTRQLPFNENKEKLTDLWGKVRDDLKMNPKDFSSTDLKKIASGLGAIIDGTMYLRDKKSGAHGRTQQQATDAQLRPRHARLVIHSAHTLAIYIIECLDGV